MDPFNAGKKTGVSGVFSGLIILALIGLGISYLFDNGSGDSHKNWSFLFSGKLKKENSKLQAEVRELERRLVLLHRNQGELAYREQKIRELEGQVASAKGEAGVLQELIKTEEESIQLLEDGKKKVFLRFRDHVREAAPGEKHAQIQTRQGKIYFDVEIIEVAPDGVSIRHRNGGVRLGFDKIPEAWISRFMYQAAEVADAQTKVNKQQNDTRVMLERMHMAATEARQTDEDKGKIANLRRNMISLAVKHDNARLQANLAQNRISSFGNLQKSRGYSRSSYHSYDEHTGTNCTHLYRPRYRSRLNKSRYVPGSLETWEQRRNRYEQLQAKYADQLGRLRDQLEQAMDHDNALQR